MYTIGNIIYGIPLHDTSWEVEYSENLQTMIADEENGFHQFYHGNSDFPPTAFGVMMDEIDECCYFVDMPSERITPTKAQVDAFNSMWDDLPVEIRDEISSKYGAPRTFILWSTS